MAIALDALEAFALKDREEALQNLVPGTPEHAYFTNLTLQHAGDVEGATRHLVEWVRQHGDGEHARQAKRRLALMIWELDPESAAQALCKELGLTFDHQREVEAPPGAWPCQLDPALTAPETVLNPVSSDLSGYSDHALYALTALMARDLEAGAQRFSRSHRQNLLDRVERPDIPGLLDVVRADLDDPHGSSFGGRSIHDALLLDQLETLAEHRPALWESSAFVDAVLNRERPGADVDLDADLDARATHLDALWARVAPLGGAFNTLKVHVLYHRLDLDQRRDHLDLHRLNTYLALPRQAHYIPYTLTRGLERSHIARPHTTISATELPAVGDDEPLVRERIAAALVAGVATLDTFSEWVERRTLERLEATAQLTTGHAEVERWRDQLGDASAFQALASRVDIDIAPTNPTRFAASDPVTLEVDVKNVSSLTIKVFEINTLNHFLSEGRDVGTDLNLDGLVASAETTHAFDTPPLHRVRRRFELGLTAPGVYIVELIGNGVSSRALIRKGDLQIASRLGAAGHVFTAFSQGEHMRDARMWIDGRAITPDDDGLLRLPYTAQPRTVTALFQHGAITRAHTFRHANESYRLHANVLLERESLIPGERAEIGLRLTLLLGDIPVSTTLLEEPELHISSLDHDDNTAVRTLPLTLHDHDLTTVTFKVPDRLARLQFTVHARVRNISQQQHVDLQSDTAAHTVASILKHHTTTSLLLQETSRGYSLLFLGLCGEPRPRRRVGLTLTHCLVNRSIHATLQTDENGRLELGHIPDITHIEARADSTTGAWTLLRDTHTALPEHIHATPADALRLPLTPSPLTLEERVSLLELRDDHFTRDALPGARIEDGDLVLPPLIPGDYSLHLRDLDHTIDLHILPDDTRRERWLVSPTRMLEHNPRAAVGVAHITHTEDQLRVQLTRATPHTRVHLIATRLHPLWTLADALQRTPREPRSLDVERHPSHYISGREIGDELRYILERQHVQPRPGNMLERPTLLLNPWSIRATETLRDEVEAGEAYGRASSSAKKKRKAKGGARRSPRGGRGSGPTLEPCLDFLAQPALTLFNLTPDADGVVTRPSAELGPYTHLRVLVTDPAGTAALQLALDEPPLARRDLRLLDSLDVDTHISERKEITPLPADTPLALADTRTARVEAYDTLESVYNLFTALAPSDMLRTFAFVTRWNTLDDTARRDLYSKHACHELNLFLHRKDPDFFDSVIRPFLTHKTHKTFIDHLLLEHDLSHYLLPHAYQRLNTAERILLAHRVTDPEALRTLLDLHDTLPHDPERIARLIDAALQGSALDEDSGLLPPPPPPPMSEATAVMDISALSASTSWGAAGGGGAFSEKEEMAFGDVDDDECEEEADASFDGFFASGGKADLAARSRLDPLYRKADTTRAWVETHYYRRRPVNTHPNLIPPGPFWADFARHDPTQPFLSPSFLQATSTPTEMLFALALLDLPFEAGDHARAFEGHSLTLTPASHTILVHEELKPSPPAEDAPPLLISQNYFQHDDRYRQVGNERVEKYVTGAFLIHTLYTCQIVLTNPTSARQKLDLLLQIPRGAIAVGPYSSTTPGSPFPLDPYATRTLEYTFYFPEDGTFPHYPAHISRNEAHIQAAEPRQIEVLRAPRERDETSWSWLSQHADTPRLLDALTHDNLAYHNLERIAWRMHDADDFRAILERLRARRVYHHTLWSYALKHHDTTAAREFLANAHRFIAGCGPEIHTPLLSTRAERRTLYEHIEYAPLFNARAHRVGSSRRILNTDLEQQYRDFLQLLCHRPAIDDDDRLAAVYYLLLQDRVEDALDLFPDIDPLQITARLPFDYLRAYLAFFTDEPESARPFAETWSDHPVDRWRKRFRTILAMLDEARDDTLAVSDTTPTDSDSREQQIDALAAREPALEFEVEGDAIILHHHNISHAEVRFFGMDIELLFSREPFVQQQSSRFSWIQPNHHLTLDLSGDTTPVPIPEAWRNHNVVIEIEGGGRRRSHIHYANRLHARAAEAYGQLRVYARDTSRPLPRAYVKAYARTHSGEVRFFKDGYTDLRGAFDYATLSTDELDSVQRFALLVMSETHGAVILEAAPPG